MNRRSREKHFRRQTTTRFLRVYEVVAERLPASLLRLHTVGLLVSLVAGVLTALAVVSMPATAGTATDVVSSKVPTANAVATTGWTNPTNAYASDSVYATAAPGAGATISSYYSGFNFDSTIPATAKITDVAITAQYKYNTALGSLETQAYVGGSACGSFLTDYNVANSPITFVNDVTKCRVWSASNLYDANFKVWVGGYRSGGAMTFSLDQVFVTVKYSAGAGGLAQTGYIFENDDEDEATGDAYDENTQQAAGNTAITGVKAGERLNARVQVRNTGPAMTNEPAAVYYDRNDGIWSKVSKQAPMVNGGGTGCATALFTCTDVDTTNAVGSYGSMAIDSSGTQWVSYYDATNGDLRVAHYVGFGGSGCATTTWQCVTVDSTNNVGQYSSIAIAQDDTVWVSYYDATGLDLRVAQLTPAGGSGCASAQWTCTTIDSTNSVGQYTSIVVDQQGLPHVSYYDTTNADLRVADYVGASGTGCAVTSWSCAAVDSTGSVGQYTSISVDGTGQPWVSYYDTTNTALKVAQYVGSSGTGCAVTTWTCTTVESANTVGTDAAIAFDNTGKPWVSYYDTTNAHLKVAQYVGGSSGSGCAVTSWTCITVDSAASVGTQTSIAFDVAGNAWISYLDAGNNDLKLARYVTSGGAGCATSAWNCTTVDSTNNVGQYSSIAFSTDGTAWISEFNGSSSDLRVAKSLRSGEIGVDDALGGSTGDPLQESHADMTSTADTTNRDDADCISGGTWSNGKLSENDAVSFSLPDGSSTPTCTELEFTLDTSRALSGATYRLLVVYKRSWRSDKGMWSGPASASAYPTLTMATTMGTRISKDTLSATMSNCTTDTAWGCLSMDTANDFGYNERLQISPTGVPWVAFRDATNFYGMVAHYVGTGGTGCASTAWQCDVVSQFQTDGYDNAIAFDAYGSAWVATYDLFYGTGRIAHYVGSGGTGCGSTAWTCIPYDQVNDTGRLANIYVDRNSNIYISMYSSGALRIAHYVGQGGTSCMSEQWSCTTIDTVGDTGRDTSMTSDAAGNLAIAYRKGTAGDLYVAHYVGSGGSGCTIGTWECDPIDTTNNVGENSAMSVDPSGGIWISYRDATATSLKVAQYVGNGTGTGCATTNWKCTTVDNTGTATGQYSSMAIDAYGMPWISFYDGTALDLRIARYVGSGGNCTSSAWNCSTIDSTNDVGQWSSLAFDQLGVPWVGFYDSTNGDIRVARMHNPPGPPNGVTGMIDRNDFRADGRYRLDFGDISRPAAGACDAAATRTGYCGASVAGDGYSDSITALTNERPLYMASGDSSVNTNAPTVTWTGQSTVAPSTDAMTIEFYRAGTTNAWVTPTISTNTCSAAAANTNCTIVATVSASISDYWQSNHGNYTVYARVIQAAYASGSEKLSTDYMNVDQPPNDPTVLAQVTTGGATINTGAWYNSQSVKFTATASDPDTADTLYLCVEYEAITVAFTGTATCSSGFTYSGSAVPVSATLNSIPVDTQYHWQARIRDAAGLYSNWVSFGGNSDTLTAATDFGIDISAPTGGTVYDGTGVGSDAMYNTGALDTLSANWSGFNNNVSGLAKYQYAIGTTIGGTDIVGWTDNGTATSVTNGSLTLQTSKMYYFSVRAVDNAGNTSAAVNSDGQVVAPTLTFVLGSSAVVFNRLNASNSYADTQTVSMTTSTNAKNGYQILAKQTTPLSSGALTISGFNGGSYAAPDTWVAADRGFGYTDDDTLVNGTNRYQPAATCPGGSAKAVPGCFAPFNTGGYEVIADDSTPVTSKMYTLTLKVVGDSTTRAGTYSSVLSISAVASF